MLIRKWYQLLVLVLSLVIADQFFKIATRYLIPEKPVEQKAFVLGYEPTPGWIDRKADMPLKIALKNLFLSQNGMLTTLILLIVLVLFHKNVPLMAGARPILPYGLITAAIVSLWLDNLGLWEPKSLHISWIHINDPVKMNLAWSEIYIFLGLIMFLISFKRNEILT